MKIGVKSSLEALTQNINGIEHVLNINLKIITTYKRPHLRVKVMLCCSTPELVFASSSHIWHRNWKYFFFIFFSEVGLLGDCPGSVTGISGVPVAASRLAPRPLNIRWKK